MMMMVSIAVACAMTPFIQTPTTAPPPTVQGEQMVSGEVIIAHLPQDRSQSGSFDAIRSAFRDRNPGYDIEWRPRATSIAATKTTRIAFVQDDWTGENVRYVTAALGDTTSQIGSGDIVLLPPGATLATDAPIDFLVFTSPDALPEGLPPVIRPDWDEQITDTPGGCATEEGAYRRVLLTWLNTNGPYIYHSLNAHRVRITDSFSHYHPVDGGFDEFYLVQAVRPGAKIIVSEQTERIVAPKSVSAGEAESLLEAHELRVHDLVYLPRGVVHRGVGGVLAQVITVPGFKPGAEIGVDHHLRAINEQLNLSGDDALPLNIEASAGPVVR